MLYKISFALILVISVTASIFGQRPPGAPPPRDGRPTGGPPRDGRPPIEDMDGRRGDGPRQGDWLRPHDTNNNGILESEEFQSAADRTFAELDKNNNGTIEASEAVRPDGPERGDRNRLESKRILPPFFFLDRVRDVQASSRADFDRVVKSVFAEMDKNVDGSIDEQEARKLPHRPDGDHRGDGGHRGERREGPGMPPNAKFIAAELRFGDKLVKGQPFSAEIVIEDTRRLYDGSTVTKQSRGAIYRDGEGRTRREQPLEMVGGVNIVGSDNKPQMLVFVNDFANRSQTFLDINNKVARKNRLGDNLPPEPREPESAETEALGTKMIDGIKVEGTRTTFDIPIGEIGNDKPIKVISERWFSPELQVLVMSRHLDPIAGEHVFKLTNIKRVEPSADLFAIPAGFRIEEPPVRKRD